MEETQPGTSGVTVVKQEQTVAKLPDGTFGSVVRITFRTRHDSILSVDVPASAYTAENARAAITARAAEADAIQNL